MSTFKKLEEFILPQEVNFFERLHEQSLQTKKIIEELVKVYVTHQSVSVIELADMMHDAKDIRQANLRELYQIFITPFDKEAISRAYLNLDYVVKSAKHLLVELEIYKVTDLSNYKSIFELLNQEMNETCNGFLMLKDHNYEKFSANVYNIVHADNLLIQEYVKAVSALLEKDDFKVIIKQKEILTQLKDLSNRIRMCANDLEDMVFKMS